MPRDCHGDLHLDHVYYFPDSQPPADLVIIDCIEFNERFRFIDPVADMAFPVMDLAFHGRRDLARAFADAYFRASGDEEGRALLPLYTAYRATVRGMVEGLELAEKEVPEAERAAALLRARGALAAGPDRAGGRRDASPVCCWCGSSRHRQVEAGPGLAQSGGFTVIRSDVVRKELAGLPGQGRTPPSIRELLYAPEWNDRTYHECLSRAEAAALRGTTGSRGCDVPRGVETPGVLAGRRAVGGPVWRPALSG